MLAFMTLEVFNQLHNRKNPYDQENYNGAI
jgi:hypothetical protein